MRAAVAVGYYGWDMFTGLIQAVGTLRERSEQAILVDTPRDAWSDPIRIGESISVNGCCLTVESSANGLVFTLSEETFGRTTFGGLQPGAKLNLERALLATDRMGGHIVQGHVDGVGTCLNIADMEGGKMFRFATPEGYDRYLADKCSIAIDGISLTVVRPSAGAFGVAVIPHTLEHTNMGVMVEDQPVNVELDILFKYVERLMGRA